MCLKKNSKPPNLKLTLKMFKEMKFLKLACYLYSVVYCWGVYKCNRDCPQRVLMGAISVPTICIRKVSVCIEKYKHGEEVSFGDCVFKIDRNQPLLHHIHTDVLVTYAAVTKVSSVFRLNKSQSHIFCNVTGLVQVNEPVAVRHD
jgi:hypothetical protein